MLSGMTMQSAWVCIAATCASTAQAQERISPEVFLDAAVGKTLEFRIFPSGEYVGTEEFLRRELSVWRQENEDCVYGAISIVNEQICFLYDDDVDGQATCWSTFSDGETFYVATGDQDGIEVQVVTSISDETLSCPIKPGV